MNTEKIISFVLALTCWGFLVNAQAEERKSLTIPIPDSSRYSFKTHNNHLSIQAKGYFQSDSYADPMLPIKILLIKLPANTIEASVCVTLTGVETEDLPLKTRMILPVPSAAALSAATDPLGQDENKEIIDGKNIKVYRRDAYYPAQNVYLIEIGRKRLDKIARIYYYPFQYNPVTSQLKRITQGQINVSYMLKK